MTNRLYLAEPTEAMEAAAMEYQREYAAFGETHINGSLGFERFDRYADWLSAVRAARVRAVSEEDVPASTWFSVRESDRRIIGTIQLRHELNEDLAERGGHIGYGIRPSERRKGYGAEQLALALDRARRLGIPRVMISCDRENAASARVALANGAELRWEGWDEEDGFIRVYWIELA